MRTAVTVNSHDERGNLDRGVGAGVAPELIAKRNSELVDNRGGAPTTPSVPRLAICTSLVDPAVKTCIRVGAGIRCLLVLAPIRQHRDCRWTGPC